MDRSEQFDAGMKGMKLRFEAFRLLNLAFGIVMLAALDGLWYVPIVIWICFYSPAPLKEYQRKAFVELRAKFLATGSFPRGSLNVANFLAYTLAACVFWACLLGFIRWSKQPGEAELRARITAARRVEL